MKIPKKKKTKQGYELEHCAPFRYPTLHEPEMQVEAEDKVRPAEQDVQLVASVPLHVAHAVLHSNRRREKGS